MVDNHLFEKDKTESQNNSLLVYFLSQIWRPMDGSEDTFVKNCPEAVALEPLGLSKNDSCSPLCDAAVRAD